MRSIGGSYFAGETSGYAACFQSALLRFASGRALDLTDSRITARVGIGTLRTGGFGLTAALDLDVSLTVGGLSA